MCLSLLVMLACTGVARGAEFRFTQANDFFSANKVKDDLYTFSIEMEFQHKGWSLRARENAYTDHENELRFDESYFEAPREFAMGGWRSRLAIGLVHVGEGALGEGFQNAIHGMIGDDPVDLSYVESSRVEPLAGFEAWRGYAVSGRLSLVPWVRARRADDFKQNLGAGAVANWRRGQLCYILGAGWSFNATDCGPLEPWLEGSAATWELGLEVGDAFLLKWIQNEYGTGRRYMQIGYTWQFD